MGPGGQESHSAEANQPPPVELLNGEVTMETGQTGMAFAGGTHCEVWKGLWKKVGGKGGDVERVGTEKVCPNLAASILLISHFQVALKTLRITKSAEKAREVRFLLTTSVFLTHATIPVRQKLERELPTWAELRHTNVLPLYGAWSP